MAVRLPLNSLSIHFSADLSNNRPLRLFLPGVFNELPVPPYVVGEWRDVQTQPLS